MQLNQNAKRRFELARDAAGLLSLLMLLMTVAGNAVAYPDVKITNNTEFTVSGMITFASGVCEDDDFTVAPGATWTKARGICLVTSIFAKQVYGTPSTSNPPGIPLAALIQPYTSSGTGYSYFWIQPAHDRYRIYSSDMLQTEIDGKRDPGMSPGYFFQNNTEMPIKVSLVLIGCVDSAVIAPGESWRFDTGSVWMTIETALFIGEDDEGCGSFSIDLLVDMLTSFALAGAKGMVSGNPFKGLSALSLTPVKALGKAMVSTSKTAIKQSVGTFMDTAAGGLMGQWAGPEWPFRCDIMPRYELTGGPTYGELENGELVMLVGTRIKIQRINDCGNSLSGALSN